MQFSNTTNLSGIIQMCEKYTNKLYGDISGDATLLKEFTNNSNIALNKLWAKIFKATGAWEYDDHNQTDLPQATANLSNGTATYVLPEEALTLKRLEVKDSNGEWCVVEPIMRDEIPEAINEFLDTDSTPRFYRMIGETIELFPAPDYDSTAGLKVYFDRGSVAFASTDTTAIPGFNSELHYLVPISASLEWLKVKSPTSSTTIQLEKDWATGLQDLNKIYNLRFSDKTIKISRAS
jgi:hypothetical protein